MAMHVIFVVRCGPLLCAFLKSYVLGLHKRCKFRYRRKKEFLYDLKVDPLEQQNRIYGGKNLAIPLKERLTNWNSKLKKYSSKEHLFRLAPEEKEKLEALGYLEKQENDLRKDQ